MAENKRRGLFGKYFFYFCPDTLTGDNPRSCFHVLGFQTKFSPLPTLKILIVEDDPTLSANISEALRAEGYQPFPFYDGLLAERTLRQQAYDCVILDVNLPGKGGFDVCREFRTHNSSTPVIILTAFNELEDKVKGFDSGADDYLSKPFFMRELMLRVASLLKRGGSTPEESQKLSIGELVMDLDRIQVSKRGEDIQLTPREFQVLRRLAQVPGEIVLKKDLVGEIWGTTMDANTNTIEVYINFLRNKLDKPFGTQTIR